MRPRTRPPLPTPLLWLRRLALPVIALVMAITMFGGGFDPQELRELLEERDIEDALTHLQSARNEELILELAAIGNWRTKRARQLSINALRQRARDGELFEFVEFPTLVEPLGNWREPPREVRLRESIPHALQLQINHIGLALPVGTLEIPPNTQTVTPEVRIVEGSSYHMIVAEAQGGAVVATERFAVLPAPMAHDVGLVLAAARDLAPDEATGELLIAIAAMHFELFQEALDRLAAISEEEGLQTTVAELRAIAYDELGLDRTALAVLEEAGL